VPTAYLFAVRFPPKPRVKIGEDMGQNQWHKMRAWRGSLETAFEELCCQLAGAEPPTIDSRFVRKSAPDAGVECYWTLPEGVEHAWQAKFFLSTPGQAQWKELDESVDTALSKHPRIARYTICLPIDRADPRLGQNWFMDKWKKRVEKWETWAKKKKMVVEFAYWGDHEIFSRLTTEKHAGRRMFWFGELEFTDDWLKKQLAAALESAGERYLPHFKDNPALNVRLPISEVFSGLGRTPEFWLQVRKIYAEIAKRLKSAEQNARCIRAAEITRDDVDEMLKSDNKFATFFEQEKEAVRFHPSISSEADLEHALSEKGLELLYGDGVKRLWHRVHWKENATSLVRFSNLLAPPFGPLCSRELERAINAARDGVYAAASEIRVPKDKKPNTYDSETEHAKAELHALGGAIGELSGLVTSISGQTADQPVLLLTGEALIGKTHLFCDVAEQRIRAGQPTLILLGQTLRNAEEPWSQILKAFGLNCSRDEFLSALNAWGEAQGCRALLMIDAINEGLGKVVWHDHLSGFIKQVSHYPAVGLALSVRSTELDATVDFNAVESQVVHVQHPGFEGVEHIAVKTYCSAFRVDLPSVPTIHPALSNPGFLYLICSSLQNEGKRAFPKGAVGITWIFETYINSIHSKLWKPNRLDYANADNKVARAIDALAQAMVDADDDWLELEKAQAIVNSFLPGRTENTKTLFNALLDEGLISADSYVVEKTQVPVCRFSFQRFEQYVIARKILNNCLAGSQGPKFSEESTIGRLVKTEHDAWIKAGFVEAFSVLVPERMGIEFADAVPWAQKFGPVRENFIRTLVWRSPSSIKESTFEYLNKVAIVTEYDGYDVMDSLLTLSSVPEHPLNADFLHKNLSRRKLAARDETWSIYLHKRYSPGSAVERVVDWAIRVGHESHIDAESRRLCGSVLAWFLTSSNRFLRDRSTKALVNLLSGDLATLQQLVEAFKGVNDVYVLERLCAATYGCAMRSRSKEKLGVLAQTVFDAVFAREEVLPHILLRDYARGIIECAVAHGGSIGRDISKARPPYYSLWPDKTPDESEFDHLDKPITAGPVNDYKWTTSHLHGSVLGFDDFSRYVVGEGQSNWSTSKLSAPPKLTVEQKFDQFIEALSEKQRKAWNKVKEQLHAFRWGGVAKKEQEVMIGRIEKAEAAFITSLTKSQNQAYEGELRTFAIIGDPHESPERVSNKIIKHLIMKKVLDLGWTVERFGEFDGTVNRYSHAGREARKPERIGKKYQWIAYHEVLARLSDNFHFYPEHYANKIGPFEGPWQLTGVRDIDPSILHEDKPEEVNDWRADRIPNWWTPIQYDGCNGKGEDDFGWLRTAKDFPDVRSMIEVRNPGNDTEWLVLHSSRTWIEPEEEEGRPKKDYRRQFWIHLDGIIVKKKDFEPAFRWSKQRDMWDGWRPEVYGIDRSFLGELYWAPSAADSSDGWQVKTAKSELRIDKEPIPCDILLSSRTINTNVSSFDCSNERRSVYVPSKWLCQNMELQWNGQVGEFVNAVGVLVCLDPSIRERGASALIVRRREFLEFLSRKELAVIWTVQAEKNLVVNGLGNYGDDVPDWLEYSGAFSLNAGKRLAGKVTARTRDGRDGKKVVKWTASSSQSRSKR
jgi:hypothetical protein